MAGVFKVEDSTGADGAEVAHEQRLFDVAAHVGHRFVEHQDGGNPTEEQHQEAEPEEAWVCDARDLGLVELVPRDDGADVHEAAEVEQHIDARVDLVVPLLRLLEELAVPVQPVAGHEAGEQVVGAEGAASADKEQLTRRLSVVRAGYAGRAQGQGEARLTPIAVGKRR